MDNTPQPHVIDYDFVGTWRMNELVTVPHAFQFNGARIRVFDIDGQRAAVGADICKALDLKDPPKAMAKLDDRDKIPLCRSDTTASAGGPGVVGRRDDRGP
jgi:hypothetical protein